MQLYGGVLAVAALAFGQGAEIDLGVLAKDLYHRTLVVFATVTDHLDRVVRAGEFDFVRFDVWLIHGSTGLVSRGNNTPLRVGKGALVTLSVEQSEEEQADAIPQATEETAFLNGLKSNQIGAVHHFFTQFHFNLADHITLGNRGGELRVEDHAGLQFFQLTFRQRQAQISTEAGFDLTHSAFPHLSLSQFLALLVEGAGFEEAETIGQQLLGFRSTSRLADGAEYRGNHPRAITYGRRHQAIAGFFGVTGLQAVNGLVTPQQQVAVALLDVVPEELLLRVDRIVLLIFIDDRTGQNGHVMGAGVMLRMRQTSGVHKVAIVHAQTRSGLVHHVGEGVFAAGNVLGQGDTEIGRA